MVRNIRWAAAAVVLGTATVAAAQEDQSLPEKAEEQAETKVEIVKSSGGAANFGQVNQLVISQDMAFNISFDFNGDGEADVLRLRLAPAADFFIQENLSIGALAYLDQSFVGDNREDITNLGLGVRGGYNIPVSESASLWPKVGVSLERNDIPTDQNAGATGGDLAVVVELNAPLLVHPANHFFVGLGPSLALKVGGAEGLNLALNSVVGGYF
jgi:hypothetical protein